MTKKFKILFDRFLVYILIYSHVIQTTQTFAHQIKDLEPEINLEKAKFFNKYPLNRINHRIDLEKDSKGNFSLNFSSLLSKPYQISYFNQGSLIAHAFIDSNYLIFQGCDKYNFIIDGPLKTNKFLCKTKGTLTLLKEVSTFSACIQANSLFIKDQFSIKGKANISSFTDIFFKGKITADFLNLKARGNSQILGDIDTDRAILSTGDSLDIGDQETKNTLKARRSLLIKAKKLNNFGTLATDYGRLFLKANEIHNISTASILSGTKLLSSHYPLTNLIGITSPENLGRLVIHSQKFQNASESCVEARQDLILRVNDLSNQGTIEGVSGGFLKSKDFENSGIFCIKEQFTLATDNFFENKGLISFGQIAFVRAKKFSNLKHLHFLGPVNISASEVFYNSGELHFSHPAILQSSDIMNGGQIEALQAFTVQSDKMNNYGLVNIQGPSDLSLTGDFVNELKGEIHFQNSAQLKYQNFYNKGNFESKGNIVSQGKSFVNQSNAQWYTKGIWKHESDEITLSGDTNLETLGVFNIKDFAKLSGKVHATSMTIASPFSIVSDPSTDLDITHHLSLKAQSTIEFNGRVLNRPPKFLAIPEHQELIGSLPKGIFFSAGKSLKKGGKVVAEQGCVIMDSEGKLSHVGLSESGLEIILKASDLLEVDDELKSYGFLDLSSEKNIVLEKSAHLKAKVGRIKAKDSLKNMGNIDVKENLSTRTLYFSNSGLISGENMHFKADRLFSNSIDYRSFFPKLLAGEFSNLSSGGTIKGEQTTIDSLVFSNTLGHISSKNLTTHSALDFNMGMRSAYNLRLSSLVGLNVGLDLPRIDSWDDILNKQNLLTAGKTLFTTFAPSKIRLAYNVGISLYRLPQMYRQGHQLYQSAIKLREQEDIGCSDVIPLLCGIKDLATSSIQLGFSLENSSSNLWNTVTDESFSFKDYVPSLDDVRDSVSSSIQDLSWWQSTAGTIAGSIGPQFTKDSLININLGASLGVNTYERSLYSLNSGINVAANTYTNDTLFGQNRGILVSSNLNISAQGDYESTGTLLGVSGSLKGHNLFIGGYTGFYEKFQAEAKNHLNITRESSINTETAILHAKTIENAGKVHGSKEATIKAEETLHQAKGAELKGQNVHAQAKNIKNEGAIRGKEDTRVIAQNKVTNSSGGSIEGKSTYVAGKNISNAGKVHGSKEATIKAEETLYQAKGAELKGQNVHAQAKNIKNEGAIRGKDYTYIEAKANNEQSLFSSLFSGNFSNFFSGGKIVNLGHIEGKNIHLKSDRLFYNGIDFSSLFSGNFSNLFSGGKIEGEQTTIDTFLSLNALGHISSHDLTINSAIDTNILGLRSAYNMNLNSLASLNMGLDLPRIDSWGDVFNVQNLKIAGKTLFTTFAPSEVRLACNVGMSLYRLPQMYRQGHQLYQSAVTIGQQEDVGFSDIIPLLCGIKDLATSSIQLGYSLKNNYESGYNLWNTVTDESFSFKDYVPSLDDVRDSVSSSIQDLSWWQSTAGTIAGSIGPQFTKDSLININLGASLGVNTYERSLYSLNSGINVAAHTYTNDTLFGQNRGILVASNLNISAQGDYESTGTLLGVSGSLKGHNLFIGGYTGFYEKFQAEAKNHLNITGDIHTSGILAIDTNTGEFLAHKLKGGALNLKLQHHNEGTRGALKMVDSFDKISQVALDMSHQDFKNTEDLKLKHAHLSGSFKSIDNGKTIDADGFLSLEGKESIVNHHAHIHAEKGLHLKSDGDITLSAREFTEHGPHDSYQVYDPSKLTTNGDLFVEAGGKLEAPMLQASVGSDAILSGVKGVNLDSRLSVYRSKEWDNSNLWGADRGYKEDVKLFQTDIQASGHLVIKSSEGAIEARGANLSAKNGNIIADGHKGVNVNPLTKTVNSHHYTSSWFGLSNSETNESHTKVRNFEGTAKDKIQFTSADGKIEMRSAQMRADKIALRGEKGIDARAIEREDKIKTTEKGLTLNVFGVDLANPKGTLKFTGPSLGVRAGYSGNTGIQTNQEGVQGTLSANHISVETGKGADTNLHGMNIQGLEKGSKVKSFESDTDRLLLGGTKKNQSSEMQSWNVTVGADVTGGDISLGGGYKQQSYQTDTHDQADVNIDQFVNHRTGAKVQIGEGIKADITQTTGEKFDLDVDHAQTKQSQSGWSAGGDLSINCFIGMPTGGSLYGGYNTGEKRSSEGLTQVNIGNETNFTRTDIHHEDYDTRFGISGGFSIGQGTNSVNASLEVGDYSIRGGYSTGQNSSGQVVQDFQFGVGYKDIQLNADTAILKKPDGKNWMAKNFQKADKVLYGAQQVLNGAKLVCDVSGVKVREQICNLENGIGIARQGAATLTKLANTEIGSRFANDITLAFSNNKCVKAGLEHILPSGISYEDALSDAQVNVSTEGLKISKIEKLLEEQKAKGVVKNFYMEEVNNKSEAELKSKLSQLGTDKASLIIKDPQGQKDHMVMLYNDPHGQLKAFDENGPLPLSAVMGSSILIAANAQSGKSYVHYDREREVHVGGGKRRKIESNENQSNNRYNDSGDDAWRITPKPDRKKLNQQFYDKHILETSEARNGNPAAQEKVSQPLTKMEKDKVRAKAVRHNSHSTRNTGYDELLQTAGTDGLRRRDAGLMPGVSPVATINGQEVTHLEMQRDLRVPTAFLPIKSKEGPGIGGGHPGAFSKNPYNSARGLTTGSPELHQIRQAEVERSSNPASAGARSIRTTLQHTANKYDFEEGYRGSHDGPVYDHAGRDIKNPESRAAYHKECALHRNQLKDAYRDLSAQSDADSLTTYIPSDNESLHSNE